MDRTLERLCAFAEAMRAGALSPAQHEALKLRMLDTIGCGVAASTAPAIAETRRVVLALDAGPGVCTLIGGGAAAVDRAAFMNCFMVRYLDYNDTYFGCGACHPSDLVPVALAAGEAEHRSGEEVLRALAAGYHVFCALNDEAYLDGLGWDHVTFGTIASAVTAAMLLRLSAEQTANAISLAAVPQVALRQTRWGTISRWKGAAFAKVAAGAIDAAYLAAHGMTGPDEALEGRFGFFAQVCGRIELRLDPARDRTADSYVKLFPLGHHAQAPVELALELRAKLGVAQDDAAAIAGRIGAIEVRTYKDALGIMADTRDKWNPTTIETADHSLPFVVALALAYGHFRVGDIERGIRDPHVLELTRKVQTAEDAAYTQRYSAETPVAIRLHAGDGVVEGEIAAASGHSSRPVGIERVAAKYHENAGGVLGTEKALLLEKRLLEIERLGDVAGLLAT